MLRPHGPLGSLECRVCALVSQLLKQKRGLYLWHLLLTSTTGSTVTHTGLDAGKVMIHERIERSCECKENQSVSVGHGLMVPTKTGHVTVEQPCTSRMQHEGSQGRQHKHNEASEKESP